MTRVRAVLVALLVTCPAAVAGADAVVTATLGPGNGREEARVTVASTGHAGDRPRMANIGGMFLPIAGHPIIFVPNVLVPESDIRFAASTPGGALFLSRDGMVFAAPAANDEPAPRRLFRVRFDGANAAAEAVGDDPAEGKANFFIGNDPARWRTDVPMYHAVRTRDLYRGIDLRYATSEGGRLKREFRVRPGADSERIRMTYTDATAVSVAGDGTLVVEAGPVTLRETRPVCYQVKESRRTAVPCGYTLTGDHTVAFDVSPFDRNRDLIIDPDLLFSTHLGSGGEGGHGIAVDTLGYIFVAGDGGYGFPTTPGSYLPGFPMMMSGIFVAKFDPGGKKVLYATLIAGQNSVSEAYDLAVDSGGHAILTGYANVLDPKKADFPTANAYDPYFGGEFDAVVVKLSPAGNALVYSTYLGGGDQDFGYGVAVDAAGNAHVTGSTISVPFPTTAGVYQETVKGGCDAFLSVFSPTGTLLYSTLLGGSNGDKGLAVAVDGKGDAVVTGWTTSKDFPTTATALSATLNGGADAFVTRIKPGAGAKVSYSTYLGGSDDDSGYGIAVDGGGKIHVVGRTMSANFPTKNALKGTFGGGQCPSGWKGKCPLSTDAFVTALDPVGGGPVYSTFLGGNAFDTGSRIAVDPNGTAYVTGWTASKDLALKDALQKALGGETDALVAAITPAGALSFATYLGGNDFDYGVDVAADGIGHVFVTGLAGSADFPVKDAYDPTLAGTGDAFVAKLRLYSPQIAEKPDWWSPFGWWKLLTDWFLRQFGSGT